MEVQLRQAARAWLRATIQHVPIWTGMSMGSFRPLGAFLRIKIPIKPELYIIGRTIERGAAASEYKFMKQGTKYTFEFDEGVASYAINEYFNVNPPLHLKTPGPWYSFRYGEAAFQEYVEKEMPNRFPRVEEALVITRQGINT